MGRRMKQRICPHVNGAARWKIVFPLLFLASCTTSGAGGSGSVPDAVPSSANPQPEASICSANPTTGRFDVCSKRRGSPPQGWSLRASGAALSGRGAGGAIEDRSSTCAGDPIELTWKNISIDSSSRLYFLTISLQTLPAGGRTLRLDPPNDAAGIAVILQSDQTGWSSRPSDSIIAVMGSITINPEGRGGSFVARANDGETFSGTFACP